MCSHIWIRADTQTCDISHDVSVLIVFNVIISHRCVCVIDNALGLALAVERARGIFAAVARSVGYHYVKKLLGLVVCQ